MARIFTVGDVITKARNQTAMHGASGLKFITAVEARAIVSHAWTWLHGMLVKADPDYFEDTQTIISTGLPETALPADYLSTKRIDYLGSDEIPCELQRITVRDVHRYQSAVSASEACAYRIVAGNVVLYPTPPSGQTYRHIYTTAPETFTSDDDEIDGRAGWEELLVLRTAMRFVMKANEDTTDLQRELDAELQRIVVQADERTPLAGQAVADVESFDDDSNWMHRLPRMR
jgi:hypothetical protein